MNLTKNDPDILTKIMEGTLRMCSCYEGTTRIHDVRPSERAVSQTYKIELIFNKNFDFSDNWSGVDENVNTLNLTFADDGCILQIGNFKQCFVYAKHKELIMVFIEVIHKVEEFMGTDVYISGAKDYLFDAQYQFNTK